MIIAPEAEVIKWTAAFQKEPQRLFWNLVLRSMIHQALTFFYYGSIHRSLSAFKQVKLYYSLGAGVDHLMNESDLLPGYLFVAIVDPLLSFSMSNYIIFAVLYYQRKWDKFLKDRKDKIWDHDGIAEENICIGILGMGTLGKDAALKLHQLGFKVIGYSPTPKDIDGITTFAKDELAPFLAQCNVLVCTVPSTPETKGLLSKPLFDQLTQPTYLINVARGAVQVEKDILEALENYIFCGAFLVVFDTVPLPKENPLWTHPKVQITPHIASITNPEAGVAQIIKNAKALEKRTDLVHVVDPKKGY